ncbi:hypothetical protein MN093_11030 [Bacillus mycoides]|uniref:hypothetical protein n=1 Tax=Bacillus mycoides TaxID=1405 RepID=UPI001F52D614|nr:hypothetical protein [Bacillus mycoides]UNJ96126.1 hypothetical protein MN093_11030 [Bacillus mycoides]
MVRTTKTPEPSYEKTCDLIYKLASARISQKYDEWKKYQPYRGAMIEIYPDRKLFGNVLNCMRTKKDNPYLLTLKLAEAIVKPLKFHDLNEVYWSSTPELYFEELFTTLLLEMQTYKDYTKSWMETPLTTESEIKDFYRLNRESIIENKEIGNGQNGYEEYKSLKDRFIDFTYNKYDYFELVDEVGEFTDGASVHNKDGEKVLTFYQLPRKINTFAEKVLLPFVSGVCLNNLIDSFEEAPTE